MMLFAFFLVFLGVILIIWGIFRPILPEDSGEKKAFRQAKKRNSPLRKEKQLRVIQKKLFNKKYPERNLLPEEERAILKEREISGHQTLRKEQPGSLPERTEVPEEKSIEPVINYIETEETQEKVFYSVEGVLYVDFSREIPHTDKNLKDMDWEESDFTHFRRLGFARLFQKGNTFEFLQDTLLYSISLEEIERIIFFNKAFCILPTPKDIPHLFFFSKNLDTVREGISSEYRRL